MGWLLEARGRASVGQWLGTALLAIGVLTGQLRAPQLLYAAWLENISVGIAATVSIARSGRDSVAVPGWVRRQVGSFGASGRSRWTASPPAGVTPPWVTPPPGAGPRRQTPPAQPAPPPPGPPHASSPSPGRPVLPPPPPGAQPLQVPGPHGYGPGPLPEGHVSVAGALLFLLVPLVMMTGFQGQFISILATIGTAGGDGSGAGGGPVAVALLVVAAAVRAFRRIDADQALGYAFGHIVTLHLGMFLAFFAIFVAAFGRISGGTGPSPAEVAVTLALVAWFASTDRLRVGNRPPG